MFPGTEYFFFPNFLNFLISGKGKEINFQQQQLSSSTVGCSVSGWCIPVTPTAGMSCGAQETPGNVCGIRDSHSLGQVCLEVPGELEDAQNRNSPTGGASPLDVLKSSSEAPWSVSVQISSKPQN